MKKNLLMFIGTDCPHCDAMRPLVAKLIYDTGITVDERDVWKNQSDFRIYENYQNQVRATDPDCQGLPFFMNTETGDYLCGEVSYTKLKVWACDDTC
jgi:thiol-disulfide isomerase/thioredoxin